MLGVAHAIACSSGTASVHLAVAALDLEPGDEVIVPPITDIGSIVPILWQNAVPVFADVDPADHGARPLERARRDWLRARARSWPCTSPDSLAICAALREIAREHGTRS